MRFITIKNIINLFKFLSPSIRNFIIIRLKRLTSPIRKLPCFIIIGAARCGTTSLYNYLIQHPFIVPAFRKEPHFFDINFYKGINWYKAFFPSLVYKYIYNQDFITGEASPYYIFHPHVPKRIFSILPNVKIIILLRNPVERAYSDYINRVKHGHENLSFEKAIEKEQGRLKGELDIMLKNEFYNSIKYRRYAYLKRGNYILQIKPWFHYFSKKQILILKSEDLFNDPKKVLKEVFRFLNLSNWEMKKYEKYNVGNYDKMDDKIRKNLTNYFKPYNQLLYDYLGKNYNWEK